MNRQAAVRIKGSRWEVVAGAPSAHQGFAEDSVLSAAARRNLDAGSRGGDGLLLDLAIRHFRGLQLTSGEAHSLAHALNLCVDGEPAEVGPVAGSGRIYRFRRHARSVSIRVGEACMRLPLQVARGLIEPLRHAMGAQPLAEAC